jgi:hypothetical protein
MRYASLFFSLSLLAFTSRGQSLNWAYSIKNPVVLEGLIDISSNQINRFAVIGNGNSGASLEIISGSSGYSSPGNFLAVYNENSQIQWFAATIGIAFGVQMNASGEVFVTGRSGAGETYLQKYSSAGALLWTGSASVDGNATEIQELSDGRIIVAGRVDISSAVTLANNATVNLDKGAYILEFSSSGSLTGAYGISVPDAAAYIYVFDLASDAQNNIYLCGQLDGIADFDLSGANSQNALTNAYDAYVVKYDANFALQWFRQFGDSNNPKGWDKARTMSIDSENNVFVGGEFTWTTDFDLSNPGTAVLLSDNDSQVPSGFILQYGASGNLNWVKKIGNNNASGNTTDYASVSVQDIFLDAGYLYLLLEGYGIVDMDPESGNSYFSAGLNSSPGFFIGKYSDKAVFATGFAIGSGETMSITGSVGFEGLGEDALVIGGTFQKSVDFDPGSEIFKLECAPGSFYNFDYDIYYARYLFSGLTAIPQTTSLQQLVYPNPFTNSLTIQEPYKLLEIFDQQGRLVLSNSQGDSPISAEHLAKGCYTLRILNKENLPEFIRLIRQ